MLFRLPFPFPESHHEARAHVMANCYYRPLYCWLDFGTDVSDSEQTTPFSANQNAVQLTTWKMGTDCVILLRYGEAVKQETLSFDGNVGCRSGRVYSH